MKKSIRFLAISGLAAALAACGGGDDPVQTAATNVKVTASTATATQTASTLIASTTGTQTFTFASGVAAFGTTTSTAVDFNGTAASPTFKVTAGAGTAEGTLGFGSCKFTVTTSTIATMPVGTTFTVNPCEVQLNTTGAPVGSTSNVNTTLVLDTASSGTVATQVTVTTSGQVQINGETVGTVSVSTGTGT